MSGAWGGARRLGPRRVVSYSSEIDTCSVSDCDRPFCRKLGTTDPAHRGGWPILASMSWRTILPNACVMQTTDRLSQSASQNAIISSAWKAQQCQKITRPVAGRKRGSDLGVVVCAWR